MDLKNTTMKRLILIAAVALLAMVMASCQKDDNATSQNTQDTSNTSTDPSIDTTTTPTVPDGFVDLGLPSGLLWATCNLGATAPEEYGGNYSWGETSTKETYNWGTYRFAAVDADGNLSSLTKYNTKDAYGSLDNKTVLESEDDAASVILGNGARIPTEADWQELLDNTTVVWTTLNDVCGRQFTASNGNSLFLPAAGRRGTSGLDYAGEHGFYWSSSLNADDPRYARRLLFNADSTSLRTFCRRYNGPAVRAVRPTR